MRHRLLITGSTGLLGSALIAVAPPRYEVIASTRRLGLAFPRARCLALDVCDAALVMEMMAEIKPTVVLHCAAETRVDWCEDHREETFRSNVEATANVSRAVAAMGSRMVYISTDSVFDGHRGDYTEEDKPSPINIYAKSKWLGELAVRRDVLDHLIIRTNFYGWNYLPKQSLGEWILEQLRGGYAVPAFQDVIFSPLLADDLAGLVLAMIEEDLRGTYHLGARDHINKFDFARAIAHAFGLDQTLVNPVLLAALQLPASRPKKTNLNSSKVQQALGRLLPSVEDGVCRFRNLESERRSGKQMPRGTELPARGQ